MFKWLRNFFVGKVEIQTTTIESPKLEIQPQTVKATSQLVTTKRKPRTNKPMSSSISVKKPRAKKNANI